jgi:hypothetical protein
MIRSIRGSLRKHLDIALEGRQVEAEVILRDPITGHALTKVGPVVLKPGDELTYKHHNVKHS